MCFARIARNPLPPLDHGDAVMGVDVIGKVTVFKRFPYRERQMTFQ